jgi:hypothetical protein
MLFGCARETFENVLGANSREGFSDNNTLKMVALFLAILLWLVILLFVAQYLWNHVLCKVVTIVKPVDNVLYILGLVILMEILYPR